MRRKQVLQAQALVEFALVAPVFFMLVFAVIDVGRAVVTYNLISNVARDGARYAVAHEITIDPSGNRICAPKTTDSTLPTYDPSIASTALQSAGPFAANMTVTVTLLDACQLDTSGPITTIKWYRVTVATQFQPYTTMVIGAGTINMLAKSKMYMYTPF